MNLSDRELLARLGAGESINAVCKAAGISRPEFDAWWREQLEARLTRPEETTTSALQAEVVIERDNLGIPHIYAENDADLFFGFGYAMAQDRLFQMDYLRRKGLGRLAEILGNDGLPFDTTARTVGLHRIAEAEWDRLSGEVKSLLTAFSAGVNAVIEASAENLPIEFGLLDYRPEAWQPVDCLAIEAEFRWYLTGRLPVIALPEVAKRTLGEGPLYDEYLLGEADAESILHPGDYPAAPGGAPHEAIGRSFVDPEGAIGSNNWVVAGQRSTTGMPLVSSDPHIAFEAVSCWYESHLCGGSFNVAGTSYVGMPAIMIGRNQRVAWGITNNICMQRDLYQERTSSAHPGCFEYDGDWKPERTRTETIDVRGSGFVELTVRSSHNGPIVDDLLPPETRDTGPVALKWLGEYHGGWLTAMLGMNRTDDIESFRAALQPWHVPTFSLVFADVDGRIGFQNTGRLPVRNTLQRGYRPGWDPEHQWQGLIPFEEMPHLADPDRGWIATANNRVAPDDFPHKLYGCWCSGWRAIRIRQMLEAKQQLSPADMRDMQHDFTSLRAAEFVPDLVPHLKSHSDPKAQAVADLLENWDHRVTIDSAAAAFFNVFFRIWSRAVAEERFDPKLAELMATGVEWSAGRLLSGDTAGWFTKNDRNETIAAAIQQSIAMLTDRSGPEPAAWRWGDLHTMSRRHVLSSRGDLAELLNTGGEPVPGDVMTVGNTGMGPDWSAATGAGFRMICDLSQSPPALRMVDAQSQSGQPGSPHYDDQFQPWLTGDYQEISLDRETASQSTATHCTLRPS
ncbi:MAG: penicillin acylase family protein [Planctomycetota bacterium]|nr:MAG: penicillin acylase family protein [Planctomycetota bacterium]REK24160.1 MAG: penicillin acylase family protein [Planctomycetota bacterium]REK38400.1 MAG: penicillin acylase family protein [Planctomycetota bacterium]